jgi:hypothetical protein
MMIKINATQQHLDCIINHYYYYYYSGILGALQAYFRDI